MNHINMLQYFTKRAAVSPITGQEIAGKRRWIDGKWIDVATGQPVPRAAAPAGVQAGAVAGIKPVLPPVAPAANGRAPGPSDLIARQQAKDAQLPATTGALNGGLAGGGPVGTGAPTLNPTGSRLLPPR